MSKLCLHTVISILRIREFMAVYFRISIESAKGFAWFQKNESLQVVDALGFSDVIHFYIKFSYFINTMKT